jgi:hypothetical protein
LAELLRLDHLTPVSHGEHGLRTLKELLRSYLTITKDPTRRFRVDSCGFVSPTRQKPHAFFDYPGETART